ncbi:glycerate kinase [uncultured Bilophila sp.]|uniref:glycerate kinase type-2 family protein n=4 Tax=uncultured Bilophila sp. TaxID=529385 RepID=UPI0026183825|nr:glycerate kinase [uncultured Bilophila sp.]
MNDLPACYPVPVLRRLTDAALSAVSPDRAVLRHLRLDGDRLTLIGEDGETAWSGDLRSFRRVRVLGAGKGAAPMAAALESLLGDRISDGLIVVKYGHDLPEGQKTRRIRVREGGHPVPDEAGAAAAAEIVDMALDCGPDDLILCVFTGGASALTPALHPDISLEDMRTLTNLLLECGATIHEINTLRKHLSRFSGGGLAAAACPATVLGLIVSDVVGDDLDVIASGPTVPDSSTFADCLRVIENYDLRWRLPAAVWTHVEKGLQGRTPDTPKAGDAAFGKVRNVLVASVRQALEAAAQEAQGCGFRPRILTTTLTGEAREKARDLVDEARRTQAALRPGDAPVCLLAGGETTVTIRGKGKGGRNQEMALAATLALADDEGIDLVCVGTDGTDGPTDAAGGFAFSGDLARLRALGLEPRKHLDGNDSYPLLLRAGTLLRTGPTRTNVMDVTIILVRPK